VSEPRILILDEPTASLDAESERAVQIALEKGSVGRTTIWVTHNPQQAEKADFVLVFTPEGIAERGSPRELLEAGGVFSSLVGGSHLTPKVEIKEEYPCDESLSQEIAALEVKVDEKQAHDIEKQHHQAERPANYSLLTCVLIIM
jgi:ABC-type multidrug transport system ATPase subunit